MIKKLLLEETLFEDDTIEETPEDGTQVEEPVEGDGYEVEQSEDVPVEDDIPEEDSSEVGAAAGVVAEYSDSPEGGEEVVDEEPVGEVEAPTTITYKVTFNLGKHDNWSRIEATSEEEAEQLVTDYVTNKWPDRDFKVIKIEEFEEEIDESLNESLNEDAPGEGKYSDKFYEYLIYLVEESKIDAFPYLIDQLIRYCKEEDLKDLWYDRMEKIATENGFNSDTTEESLQEDYDDELSKARRYLDLMIPETCREIESKLEKASEGALLTINRHCLRFTSAMDDMAEYFSVNESLNESVTDGEPIEPGPAVGMAAVISDLIKDEYEAIDGYNSAIATAASEGYDDMIAVLCEIQAEENVHIGQLQSLMNMVDPNAHLVDDGRQEGEEQLSSSTVSMSEDWHDMNDREYSRMKDIVYKFHKMTPKQFMDLYISGTIRATFVQDSDDIPGYNETIDIDSTDLSQGTGNVVAYVMLSPVDGQLYGYVSY